MHVAAIDKMVIWVRFKLTNWKNPGTNNTTASIITTKLDTNISLYLSNGFEIITIKLIPLINAKYVAIVDIRCLDSLPSP